MSGQKEAKRGRRPKATDPHELAAILEYARLHDDQAAAEKFGISARSIRRRRAAMKAGKAPELAALVLEQKKAITARSADLICDTVDQLLRELQERRKSLSNTELIEAVDKVGSLRVTRDALNPHAEPADADKPSARPAEGSGEDPGGAVRPPGAAPPTGPQPPGVRVH